MATKRKENGQPSQPDLPAVLTHVVEQGAHLHLPMPKQEELDAIPQLVELMSPRLIRDPRWSGQGTAPLVLREPLLMVSWDRRAGGWKLSLSDKVLNVSGSCLVVDLLTALVEGERGITEGRWNWAQKKIRAK
jgi:hypothetical protein